MNTKYIPAVLVGALVASAAFLFLHRSGDDIDPSSTESRAIGTEVERLPSDRGGSNTPVVGVVQSSEPQLVSENMASRGNVAAPDAALPPPDLPIQLPRELEYFRKFGFFKQFERKPIDPDWSPQAEFQLSDYFSRHPEIVNVYGMPTIHCRESGCLALFVAYGYLGHVRNYPDPKLRSFADSSMGAGEIFRADNKEFFNDPAAKQFSDKEGVVSEGYLQDGVAGIVWIVPRRKADK